MLDFIYGAFYFLFGTSFVFVIIAALIASLRDW
jgi:hypothetical protein